MKLVTVFNHEELRALQTAVIVEMWDRVLGTGSGKRKFNAEFNPEEQKTIRKLYKTFYKWHFGKVNGTGIPQNHAMTIQIYELTKRACNFFGTY